MIIDKTRYSVIIYIHTVQENGLINPYMLSISSCCVALCKMLIPEINNMLWVIYPSSSCENETLQEFNNKIKYYLPKDIKGRLKSICSFLCCVIVKSHIPKSALYKGFVFSN